ncbi:hypothetical protein FV233_26465 [Methylobacterium sp. WL7]|nr:hypothetical protein FV233_26465 [Methylobacterium sp. WL7]
MVRTASSAIDPDRFTQIATLAAGAHREGGGAMCAMEAVAYIAREPPSDQPECASPSIAAFIRTWSDGLPQAERDGLILPLLPRLVGTHGSDVLERRRVVTVADWLVRTHLPAWFHLAKLNVEADELADLPELQAIADLATLCDHLKRARKRAAVANLTLRQTGSVVRAAAWDAAQQAAWVTIRDALEAAGPPILAAGWDAAYASAYAAARAYGKAPLEPTRRALQHSALALVERLIEARDPASDGSERSAVPAPAHHSAELRP